MARSARTDGPVPAFYRELKTCTRKSKFYVTPTPFVLASRLLDWLREKPEDGDWLPKKPEDGKQPARANIILETVYQGTEPYPGAFSIFDEAMKKGKKRCWLELFVILLQMVPDGSFASTLHVFYHADIFDTRLTHDFLQSQHLLEIIKKTGFYDSLNQERAVHWFSHYAKQLSTRSAITMDYQRSMGEDTILPITAKDDINDGGQSNVFRIEVPCECVSHDLVDRLRRLGREAIPDENYPDGKYYVFALKKIADREDWDRENRAHRALQASRTEGNVQCFGSWEVRNSGGTADYYILIEFSWADLGQYFRSIPPPSYGQEIYDFWRALSNVVPALSHIHTIKISSDGSATKLYYGWHGDIKPANILICDDGIKLTDPGWAQIKSPEEVNMDEKGLPIVVLQGGTSSYGGPERISPETKRCDGSRPITQRFDIWSLACVFLEAATWVILGIRGVDRFRTARKMAHRRPGSNVNSGDDCFHHGEHMSIVVVNWIELLKRSIRQEDHISFLMLNIIKKEMLLEQPHNRADSEKLALWVGDALSYCERRVRKLPKYNLPALFGGAFDLEQKNAANDWEGSQSESAATKMLDRSAKFTRPRGPLMDHDYGFMSGNHRTSGPGLNIAHTPILHSLTPRYTSPVPDIQAQWPTAAVPTSPAASALGIVPRDFGGYLHLPPLEEKQPTFDYYAALDFLITKRGWVYSSVLEHPESSRKPPSPGPVINNKGLAPPAKDTTTRASNWLSRTPSVRKGDHRNGYASAASELWHKFKSRSKSKTSKKRDSLGRRGSDGQQTHADPLRTVPPDVTTVQPDATFGALFSERDIVLLVDNSSTMAKHWSHVQDILPVLMAMLSGQDADGVDLYFTSSTEGYDNLMEPWELTDPLRQKDPRSRQPVHVVQPSKTPTPEKDPDDIYRVLTHILSLIGPGEKYHSKVTILILTDGVWPKTNKVTVQGAISNWLRHKSTMEGGESKVVLNDRYYSIQFVQFGEDPFGTEALIYLDDCLAEAYHVPDIIDVEPASGNVLKMIMGSLDDMWDQKDQGSEAPPSPVPDLSSVARHQQPNSPSGDPLPSQPLSRDTRTATPSTITWGELLGGTSVTTGQLPARTTDPMFGEPMTQRQQQHEYVTSAARPHGAAPHRSSIAGPAYAGPELPPYPVPMRSRPPLQTRTPPQPPRLSTQLGLSTQSGLSTPVLSNRRRTGFQ